MMQQKKFLVLAYNYLQSEPEFLDVFSIEAIDKKNVIKKAFQEVSKKYPKRDGKMLYLDIEQVA